MKKEDAAVWCDGKRAKIVAAASWLCWSLCTRCSEWLRFRPRQRHPQQTTLKNKWSKGTLPIAAHLNYISHYGTGSTLTALSSICACGGSHGCRRPLFIIGDRLQICWFARCLRANLWWSRRWSGPDCEGNHSAFPTATVDRFTPAVSRCRRFLPQWAWWEAPQMDLCDNLTPGRSQPCWRGGMTDVTFAEFY